MKPTTITLKRDVVEYAFEPAGVVESVTALRRPKTRIQVKLCTVEQIREYLANTTIQVAPNSKHAKTVGHAYGIPIACAFDAKKKTVIFYPVPDEAHAVEVAYKPTLGLPKKAA